MKRLALLTATILVTASGLLLVWLLSEVLGLFLTSVALAAALRPLLAWLKGRGVGEGLAILICYGGIVLLLASGLVIYSSLVGTELALILDNLPGWYDGMQVRLASGSSWQQVIANALPSTSDLLSGLTLTGTGSVGNTILGISSYFFNTLIFVVGVLSLAYYWLVDQNRFERLWLSLLLVPTRIRARTIWRAAEREVGVYVRAETFVVAFVALVMSASYTLIGLPFPALLGLSTGVAQLVPWLGGPLMILVAAGIGLLSGGPALALSVLGVGLAVELGRAYVLRPRLYQGAQRINSLLVVLLLLILGTLGGPLAVLLAAPLAALIQVIYQSVALGTQRLARTDTLPELERLAGRAAALDSYLAGKEEPRPELNSILRKVHSLVERAEGSLSSKG